MPERLVRTASSLGYPEEKPPPDRPKLQQGSKPLSGMVHEDRYEQGPSDG
ncbi:MAG: hypothetical protein M3122_07775 [Actinomycetota bacterium]|nr:hypothetical protein [Actinomycetota bacterium]